MSEGNSPNGGAGVFAKRVQRQLSRGKEKVLQKLGKTVETKDEQFEHCLQNLTDQQSDGSRLYKDLKVYLNSVREMREASKRLSMSLFDVYEPDWDGDEDLGGIVEAEDLLWNDYEGKLLDQSLHTMESYMSQFPDVRERVAKRGRKLIDYDSSRHHLEALQNAKKRDDIKISKAEVEVNRAQSVFEGINTELRDELPALYDSRIGCYVSVFTAISNLRDIFYKEMGKLNHDLQNVMKELQAQHPDKVFVVKGLQRTGSLKRRSLMSPRSWKASFSDVHTSYSPKHSYPSREHRSSFRSSDRPRLDESCTSTPVITPRSLSLDDPSSEARDVDADFTPSDDPIAEGKPKSDMDDTTARASGADPKSGEEGEELGEEEKDMKDGEPEPSSDQHSTSSDKNGDGDGDGESSALIESTSQVTNSHDSESLELQPSATDNTPMTLEETLESPEVLAPNGVQNGEASDSVDPPDTDGIVQKGAPLEKQVSENVRTTVV